MGIKLRKRNRYKKVPTAYQYMSWSDPDPDIPATYDDNERPSYMGTNVMFPVEVSAKVPKYKENPYILNPESISNGIDYRDYDEKYLPREMTGDLAFAMKSPHEKGLEIVSPEFDALMLGRSLPLKVIGNNIGTGLYKLADIPKSRLRTAIYNNIPPYGYRGHGSKELVGVLKDFFSFKKLKPDVKYPIASTLELLNYQAASPGMCSLRDRFRMQAWRKAMRIPEVDDIPIYTLNKDGTYGLNVDNFKKLQELYGGTPDGTLNMLKNPVSVHADDALIGNHGCVAVVETPNGLTMQDSWTLRPFRTPYDNFFSTKEMPKWIPKFVRNKDLVELVGGDPFVFKYDLSGTNPDVIDRLRLAGKITTKDLPIPKPLPSFLNINMTIPPVGIGSTINLFNNND